MKLFSVSDGPPSLAVRQCLKALEVDYELINVDFGAGDHMTEEYAKVSARHVATPSIVIYTNNTTLINKLTFVFYTVRWRCITIR